VTLTFLSQLLALFGLGFAVIALGFRWRGTQQRPLPSDRSPAKGSPRSGLLYAFTLGMAPWAKESTRRHMLSYLRGVAFHVGIFAGLAALVLSPWWVRLPEIVRGLLAVVTGCGAVFGALGEIARWAERNLRLLSTPDDHFAVILVSLFLAMTSLALLNPSWLVGMYLSAAVMLVYVPLGKIRHCIYFFFSRRFFGLFIGRRAVIHHRLPAAAIREG
jgi:nitrate reductase gamma subunit